MYNSDTLPEANLKKDLGLLRERFEDEIDVSAVYGIDGGTMDETYFCTMAHTHEALERIREEAKKHDHDVDTWMKYMEKNNEGEIAIDPLGSRLRGIFKEIVPSTKIQRPRAGGNCMIASMASSALGVDTYCFGPVPMRRISELREVNPDSVKYLDGVVIQTKDEESEPITVNPQMRFGDTEKNFYLADGAGRRWDVEGKGSVNKTMSNLQDMADQCLDGDGPGIFVIGGLQVVGSSMIGERKKIKLGMGDNLKEYLRELGQTLQLIPAEDLLIIEPGGLAIYPDGIVSEIYGLINIGAIIAGNEREIAEYNRVLPGTNYKEPHLATRNLVRSHSASNVWCHTATGQYFATKDKKMAGESLRVMLLSSVVAGVGLEEGGYATRGMVVDALKRLETNPNFEDAPYRLSKTDDGIYLACAPTYRIRREVVKIGAGDRALAGFGTAFRLLHEGE